MRLTKFRIESFESATFEGFTKSEYWNGWDCPYFTRDQAQKILTVHNTLISPVERKLLAHYDAATDAFVFPLENGDDELEAFAAFTEGGLTYYPVGAFCWIWEEVNK